MDTMSAAPLADPGRATSRLAPALITVLLVAAACASSVPTPGPSGSATGAASVRPTSEPTPTAEPSPSPTPSESPIGETCVPDPPFDPASGWTRFESENGYSFLYTESWIDVTGQISFDPETAMSPQTLAEISSPPSQIVVDAVRDPDGAVLSVWRVDGVTSDTETLFERERAWLEGQANFMQLILDRLEVCIAGQPALGFVSEWSNATFIAIFLWERDGALYQAQVTSDNQSDMDFLGSAALASWEWGAPPTDGTGAITGAAMTLALPETFEEAVPTTTFSVNDPRIHVVYDLADGSVGPVTITWREGGAALFSDPSVFDWTEDTTFAWAWINPAPGGFPPGSYDVVIEFGDDRRVVAFTIQE